MEQCRCVETVCAAVVECKRLQGDRAVGSVEGYISGSQLDANFLMPNLLILIACSSLLLLRVALLSCFSVCKHAVYCNQNGSARAYRNDIAKEARLLVCAQGNFIYLDHLD